MTIYIDSGDNTQVKRVQRIRDAADGVTTASISDVTILEKLEKSDRWIETMTGKAEDGWLETDDKWQTVLEASENRAASKLSSAISKDTHDSLVQDYRDTVKALNKKDSEIQQTNIANISKGVNITNELDSEVYTPDQTVFTNG